MHIEDTMVRDRPVKPNISDSLQKEVNTATSEAIKQIGATLERIASEMKEFHERRLRVREKIESGARKTNGRIV
jgi:hypothetical protein